MKYKPGSLFIPFSILLPAFLLFVANYAAGQSGGSSPPARDRHTAVWTGKEMIVWGGFDAATYPTDGGCYNPATDSWVALPTNVAPPLSISLSGSGTAVLSWPSPAI